MLTFSDLVLLLDKIRDDVQRSLKGSKAGHAPPRKVEPTITFQTWLSCISEDVTHAEGLLIFRLLFPEHDIRRRYGLQETLLARGLEDALHLPHGILGLTWNDPVRAKEAAPLAAGNADGLVQGCLGATLANILSARTVKKVIASTSSSQAAPIFTLQHLDILLDELASYCKDSCNEIRDAYESGRTRGRMARGLGIGNEVKARRPRRVILEEMFSTLSPNESSYLCQIVLRDLGPLLYPLPAVQLQTALLDFNSKSRTKLDIQDALRTWHWALPAIRRVRPALEDCFAALEDINPSRRVTLQKDLNKDVFLNKAASPRLGTRIEVSRARTLPWLALWKWK